MAIPGVLNRPFGSDFVSVSKGATAEWQHLRPAYPRRDHGTLRLLGTPYSSWMTSRPPASDEDGEEFFSPDDAETVATIKELLETRICPAVAGDGGDITFRGFKDGIVYLAMKGACSGCPSSTATLKSGIQNLLKHFLPDVQAVEQV